MADKQVRIVISAQDSFSSVMNKYSSAMGQATADTKQFDQAAQGSGAGVENLATTVGNAIKGFIAFKAVGMAAEMVSLGNAANATQATFNALNGDITTATNTLNSLRQATGGVVADTELMAGANRLLAMNIATTGQQAADLAGVAVNLGRAFGQDASSAIENFSLMIANQSLLRLDSLGISAAAVRERMKELKEEFPEMDKQARFTQATLEQATVTVDRLGTSIAAAQTPVAQLQTSFENLKTTVGQSMASVVNDALTAAGQLVQIFDMVSKNGLDAVANAAFNPENSLAQQRALPIADAGVEAFAEFLDMGGVTTTMTGLQMQEILNQAFTMVEEDPSLKSNWGKVVEGILGAPFDETSPTMLAYRDSLAATYKLVTAEMAITSQNQARELSRFQAYAASQVAPGLSFDQMQAQNYQQAKYGALTDMYGGTTGIQKNAMQSWGDAAFGGADNNAFGELLAQMEGAQIALDAFQSNAGGVGKFIDAGTMDGINAQFEKLRELNEQGLITDDNLAKAEEFKNKAEEAAKAFEDMSLTDIFGQTSGGMEGEIGDLVIKQMQDSGASEEQINAARRQFDLGSGRETGASVAMQDTLAPMLAGLAETDPATAQLAIENIDKFLKAAALMNLSNDQIAAGLPGAAGLMPGGGTPFTVAPGQGVGQVANQYGLTPQQVMAQAGNGQYIFPGQYNNPSFTPDPNFDPNAYAQQMGGSIDQQAAGQESPFDMAAVATDKIKDNTADIAEQVDGIALAADGVTKAFDDAAAPRTMQITVETIDKTGGLLKAILGGLQPGSITLGSGTTTRDNGGRVAGVDTRVGQKPNK